MTHTTQESTTQESTTQEYLDSGADQYSLDQRAGLLTTPLLASTIEKQVLNDQCGAVTTFCGRVRDHNEGHGVLSIVYEAYEAMALKVIKEILGEADQKFPETRSVAHHRLGTLGIGDIAVIVSVAAAHRKVTFEACAWIIDELKARTPIFKHEQRDNGVVWVGLGP